jgi:hypothetical protein
MNQDGPIFISEDLAGVTVRRGLRGLAYSLYAYLLDFTIRSAIRSVHPSVAVVPGVFAERNSGKGGSRFVTNNYVISKSFAHADLSPLVQLRRTFIEAYHQSGGKLPARVLEPLCNHILLAGLLEHVARPAEAYARFLAEIPRAREVVLLSGHSAQEEIAGQVATAQGKKVRFTFWRTIASPFFKLRSWKRRWSDGLPPLEVTIAQYSPGGRTMAARAPSVVMFCVEERRIYRLQRNLERLAKSGVDTTLTVLNSKKQVRRAMEELKNSAFRIEAINSFLPAAWDSAKAHELNDSALAEWDRSFDIDAGLASLHYQGVNLARAARMPFRSAWAKKALEARLMAEAAEQYLEQKRPDLVFITDDGLHSSILARICEERGIPTVSYTYNPVLFTVGYWKRFLFETTRSSHVLTATEAMAIAFREEGLHPSVSAVGDVFAEKVSPEQRATARQKLRADLGLGENAKVLLALSSFVSQDLSESQKRAFFRCIGKGLRNTFEVGLVVKAHPNEDLNLLKNMLAEEGIQANLLAQNESLKTLLIASDAACMMFSQAGMEAIMADTPLFLILEKEQLPGFEDWVPYVREGGAVFVPVDGDFSTALSPVLNDVQQRERHLRAAAAFREKFITSLDQDPVERMHEQLLRLLGKITSQA